MRKDDQFRILTEVESRVADRKTVPDDVSGTHIREALEDSLYHERRRIRGEPLGKRRMEDAAFWANIERQLRGSPDKTQKNLLRAVIRRYGQEIAGNFDERVYNLATRAIPPALGLLLNAVSPRRLVERFPHFPKIDDAVIIQGETEHLHRLHDVGTVILTPTHVSNLDSIVIGYSLFRLGLPPFVYGAGLNLFSNPLIGFFMHNLGAYTVDRRKNDALYKEVLKEYATLTLEHGYDNLFFPGGTRSRSGAIERRLKLGLLGTGLAAYINNRARGALRDRVFIVPATLSCQLALEAETLIDDFLKEVGKSRYIIDDDEFAMPKRIFDFFVQLMNLDSKIHVTISRGLDPFGNPVDDEGQSMDPCGRTIDITRYITKDGVPTAVEDRDAEYTKELGLRIGDAFLRDNVLQSTHITARAIFGLMRRQNRDHTILRLIRTGGMYDDFEMGAVYREADRVLSALHKLEGRGGVRLGPSLRQPTEDVINDGLAHFAIYHTRPAAFRRGNRLVPKDRNLLFYYQNRIEGLGIEADLELPPALSPDHRGLANAA
ncbi:MAG: 1-acyl-sn-glycerol-3-phosphate acyltransferase [Deltaproteobacteria bacterium]|nr:1-acyl-sn-glycerol-3-phosphate acyltransferase [Deltaproteobacteria bacterium]